MNLSSTFTPQKVTNTMKSMDIREFLNRKYMAWQVDEFNKSGERKQLDGFAAHVGVSQSLMSMWLNGTRSPGPKNKQRIIEIYGKEAIEAFGEDPDLYFLNEQWESVPADVRRSIVKQVEKLTRQNDTKQSHQKRTTGTAE
jgi:transcriptional regulator with XRE-family HTH domain